MKLNMGILILLMSNVLLIGSVGEVHAETDVRCWGNFTVYCLCKFYLGGGRVSIDHELYTYKQEFEGYYDWDYLLSATIIKKCKPSPSNYPSYRERLRKAKSEHDQCMNGCVQHFRENRPRLQGVKEVALEIREIDYRDYQYYRYEDNPAAP